jgi:hypothetical protein
MVTIVIMILVILATIMLVITLMIVVTGSAKAVSVRCAEHLGYRGGAALCYALALALAKPQGDACRLPHPLTRLLSHPPLPRWGSL